MKALWAIGWYLFLKIAASQTNQLLFRNWAGHVTNSARTGDDKDCGSLLCCEKSCNTAMLCSRTSAGFQLRRTRFNQVHWIFLFPGQEERGPNHCWIWDSSFYEKQVQGVKGSSFLIHQHCTFPLVYTTIYYNFIILFIRNSKMYVIYPVLPM